MTDSAHSTDGVSSSTLEEKYEEANDELDTAVMQDKHDQELYWLGRKAALADLLDE